MSDHEEDPPGVDAGAVSAVQQPLLEQPAISQPGTRPIANFQVSLPDKFSFKPDDWPKWIQRFERFRKAAGLDKQRGENQVNTLIYAMGDQADDILVSFELTPEQEKNYEEVKEKFENYFIVKRNIIFERAKFNSRKQQAGEPVDNFITDLHNLARYCNFGALKDELIRDRIVVGIENRELSERMQLNPNLTLEKATNLARQRETVKQQQTILDGGFKSSRVEVDGVVKGNFRRKKDSLRDKSQEKTKAKLPENSRTKPQPEQKCQKCLGNFHPKKNCPARLSKCRKCLKIGHWAQACKSSKAGKLFEIATDEENFFLGEVVDLHEVQSDRTKSPWMTSVFVDDKQVDFKIDSGADVTVMPYDTLLSLDLHTKLEPTDKVLMGPCNYKLNCKGKVNVTLSYNSNTVKETIYAVESLARPLLGRSAAVKLNLISRVSELTSDEYKAKVMRDYPKLFSGLGAMKEEYTIKLKDDAKPFALSVPRKVPMPLYDITKSEIDRMLTSGVISPVDSPTEWCAPMVVTPKPNGKVRVCVDLTKLNEYVQRENHPLPSVDVTLGKLAGAKYFTKLDANSGFWQIKLSENSRPLTTFITPWGRYCFNVLPYGISSGSEKFQKCMSKILEGLDGVECNIDDVLVHASTQELHDKRLEQVLKRLNEAGVTLNVDKCTFRVPKIKFLGNVVSADGIEVDPDKVSAVVNLPVPKNVHEVRVFLGMVNHLSKFEVHLADKTKPIRDLMQKDHQWVWGPPQQKAFEEIKSSLTKAPVLALYDPNKETKVSADASSFGLGGVLLQQQEDKTWRPVVFASRALTPVECKYAQIEKEALALTWACERFSDYIVGKSIVAETDHKPLVPLLTTRTLDDIPPRVQRLRMRLMRFQFKEVNHVPGKELYIADALSRMQTDNPDRKPTVPEEEMNIYINSILDTLPVSDVKLMEIKEAQDEDPVCQRLKSYCMEGWPDKFHLHDAVKPYWPFRGELTVVHGILLKSSRIVVPSAMRLQVLDKVHEGHQGIVKCRERAKTSIWWPGLSREIQDLIENCKICAKHRQRRAEPLMPTPFPERPWQMIGTDLFEHEKLNYLIVVDYFSRYIEVAAMQKTMKSHEVIRALKAIFARHGIPEEVRSDNGPQYASAEFTSFAKDWGFKHTTSSPYFPQSNGEVERAVETAKSLLKKEKDPSKGLLAYRSTPLACGYSPSELLMGRKLRTTIPTFHSNLYPSWPDMNVLREREVESKEKQRLSFNRRHNATPLNALQPGTAVHIKESGSAGIVSGTAGTPRSYVVETDKGTVRRNRSHINPIPPDKLTTTSSSDKSPTPCGSEKQPQLKVETPVKPLPSPCLLSRPKRIIRPSLKLKESLGLC